MATRSTSPAATIHKPRLRGVLHMCTAPVALVAGIVLVLQTTSPPAAWSVAVYAATSVLLFATSGIYHTTRLGPRASEVLRRMDHSNIYLIIAGTYTPFAVLALDRPTETILLLIMWIGAAAGVAFRTLWMSAPRWLYTGLYIALGWVAIFFIPQFLAAVGLTAIVLIVAGGLLYSGGAVVYGMKRPNFSPEWFGFHELFHTFTVAAYVCQFTAIAMLVAEAN